MKMNKKPHTSIVNWIEWHEKECCLKIDEIFRKKESASLHLNFTFRCPLEKNAIDFLKYLKVILEYDVELTKLESLSDIDQTMFEIIGVTNQGSMSKERLRGWVSFLIEIGHEFGCWLKSWGAKSA
jgi:hypothetical protein